MNLKNLRPYFPDLAVPAALAALSLAVALAGDATQGMLRYERGAILQGEWWRLFTGHFVHFGWSHLWLNLAGLGLVVWIATPLAPLAWVWATVASMAAVSGGLLLFHPEVSWYVGLSGVLHGLLVAGLWLGLRRDPGERIYLWMMVAVTGKLLWEQWAGPMPGSERSAGGPVLVDAHFYGAIGGFAAALLLGLRPARGRENRA